MRMDKKRLVQIIEQFKSKRIAVMGDFFLDRVNYVDRELDELSVETGLTAYQVVKRNLLPGAAGTVTNNLSAIGVDTVYSIGIMGDDGDSYDLIKGLRATNVRTEYMVKSDGIFTPTYIKTIFSYPERMEETHRIDIFNRKETPKSAEKEIQKNLREVAEKVDAIIILEQLEESKNGVFTKPVIDMIRQLGKEKPGLTIVADSRFNILDFGSTIVKCNNLEAVRAMYPDYKFRNNSEPNDMLVDECITAIAKELKKPVFVSCGSKGIKVGIDGQIIAVPAYRVEGPIDICGAGDSATTGITCALCSGATPQEAAAIGNIIASITIQQIGITGTATIPQILSRLEEYVNNY